MKTNPQASFTFNNNHYEVYPLIFALLKKGDHMQLDTVIFDMDGLLVDSEPLWAIAANEVFEKYGFRLSPEQHITTTGLRTREFVHWWFSYFHIAENLEAEAEEKVLQRVLDLVSTNCKVMSGVQHAFDLFYSLKFKIGIASSSPRQMIEVVMDLCGIRKYVKATASAQHLTYGKPHPQVYLNCAESLGSLPTTCVAFEDSFYGMIAAKAARMKCVVVPEHKRYKEEKWGAADLKLSSLQNFNALHLQLLQ